MDLLVVLAVATIVYLVVRGVREAPAPHAAGDEVVRGARSGVEVDPTLPRPDPSAVVPERIARLREDAAFFEGVIFSNYLLPDEYREYLPGYGSREDLEEHAYQLGMDLEELEELAIMGDADDLVDALHHDPDLIHDLVDTDLVDDPYDAYDLYDGHGYDEE